MTNADLRIRQAHVSDAAALAELAERTFRAAFGDANTDSDMDAYVQEVFSAKQVAHELSQANQQFLLVFKGDAESPKGYAKLRTNEPPAAVGPSPIELQRLYVEPGTIGRGMGAALMQACLEMAESAGHQTLWLGVWQENQRAIEFYRRWGFQTVGSHVFRLGSDDQTDLIMQRTVTLER